MLRQLALLQTIMSDSSYLLSRKTIPTGTPEELVKLPHLSNKAVHCMQYVSIG